MVGQYLWHNNIAVLLVDPLLIVPLVFLIVLVTGYYVIFRQLSEQPKTESEDGSDTILVNGERYDSAVTTGFRCEIVGGNRSGIPGDVV